MKNLHIYFLVAVLGFSCGRVGTQKDMECFNHSFWPCNRSYEPENNMECFNHSFWPCNRSYEPENNIEQHNKLEKNVVSYDVLI